MTEEEYEKEIIDLKKQLKKLKDELVETSMQRTKYLIALRDNDLLEDISQVSDAEVICEEQLRKLKDISARREFTQAEAKIFDILTLNLQRARGGKVDKKSTRQVKALSDKELMELLKLDNKEKQ